MHHANRILGTWVLIALAALAACDQATEKKSSCFEMSAPGVVAYIPGVDLTIRDVYGRGEALGAHIVVHQGADSMMSLGEDTLHARAGYTYAGTFTVRVSRPFYRDTVVRNVVVRAGECSVLTTAIPVTLQLAPNAPAIRSITLIGAEFLFTPGEQRRLTARFDVDPVVPTTVRWRLSDTTLVRIDDAGVVTSKCTLTGGSETVTAIATVDTTFQATTQFSVQKQTECPAHQ